MKKEKKFVRTILRGVGQVMLQNNAYTGLFFLIGIFYSSWTMGIMAILGNLASTITAYTFKYKKENIENGVYGFNGVLIGVAIYFYFGLSIVSTIFIIIGAILSTLIMYQIKKKMLALTAPFVISTWLIFLVTKLFDIAPLLSLKLQQVNNLDLFQAMGMSFGQVMFQTSLITGVIFLIAILINSRQSALYAIYGAILGSLVAVIFSLPIPTINLGLWGYNALLCGIVLESIKWKGFLYASLAIVLSVVLYFICEKIGIPALTAPFVVATWITLAIKGKKYLFTSSQTL